MKKLLTVLLIIAAAACYAFTVTSCVGEHEHIYGGLEQVTAPTCTQEGVGRRVCTICRHAETEVLPALDHDWNEFTHSTSKPLNMHTRYCKRDGCNEAESTACFFTHKVIPPTSEAQGYTLHTCATCGYSYSDNFTSID